MRSIWVDQLRPAFLIVSSKGHNQAVSNRHMLGNTNVQYDSACQRTNVAMAQGGDLVLRITVFGTEKLCSYSNAFFKRPIITSSKNINNAVGSVQGLCRPERFLWEIPAHAQDDLEIIQQLPSKLIRHS